MNFTRRGSRVYRDTVGETGAGLGVVIPIRRGRSTPSSDHRDQRVTPVGMRECQIKWTHTLRGAFLISSSIDLTQVKEAANVRTIDFASDQSRRLCMTNQKRRRFKQTISLNERLDAEADRLKTEARSLPPCALRDDLIRKAREFRNGEPS
jgi:hypothetical protein